MEFTICSSVSWLKTTRAALKLLKPTIMLAFTDESLARLIRAASSVSYRKRARWLEATARDLEGANPNTRRIARHRQRLKQGRATLAIEVDLVATEELLLSNNLLQEHERDITIGMGFWFISRNSGGCGQRQLVRSG
jgi:hypothetical protein